MSRPVVIALVALFVLAIGSMFVFLTMRLSTPVATPVKEIHLTAEDLQPFPSAGSKDAKVTIVEFADFECPACRTVAPLLDEVIAKYGNRIHFVYVYYPLISIHPHALVSAQAGHAAFEQGKFWEMHKVLFAHQDALTKDNIFGYLKEAGIPDEKKFKDALNSEQYKDIVLKGRLLATGNGLTSTPTLFINNKVYDGKWTLDDLSKLIDAQL